MSQILWILDPGHGGLINGEYQTPGKRSPKWDDEITLYEGEFNRGVVNRIIERCVPAGIRYYHVSPEMEDTSLPERVARANKWNNKGPCIYLSVHANAGGGKGWEIYTSKGQTKSDKIATIFYEKMREEFAELPSKHFRRDYRDGDPDKEMNFYVLKHTKMPAVLTENFFMDNNQECREFLMNRSSRSRIADAHFRAMLHIEQTYQSFV
ncbi:N-acetylmuramoyl-L-alanine amidase [Flammeovirgaceae bacterium SG7u.111]|nr:N-acetylmuramoyl-L-alanine amidase [Flammeovirgaceae bacterium SG7u.132]WPO35417.1 N-acetylmuramoyl-L-alanine amidase [Flammeovirgaceae bacterium SG7u.111]